MTNLTIEALDQLADFHDTEDQYINVACSKSFGVLTFHYDLEQSMAVWFECKHFNQTIEIPFHSIDEIKDFIRKF